DPGGEAALELLGIERGQDVTQVVVRRRAVLERTEAAQQRELLGPEQRDLGEALCTRQHRKQTQQQDLIERIGNLALLARVLEVFEIPQKDNRLVECRTVRSAVHGRRPSCESEDRHGFSTSDVCHALLHPIALWPPSTALANKARNMVASTHVPRPDSFGA